MFWISPTPLFENFRGTSTLRKYGVTNNALNRAFMQSPNILTGVTPHKLPRDLSYAFLFRVHDVHTNRMATEFFSIADRKGKGRGQIYDQPNENTCRLTGLDVMSHED